MTEPRFQCSRCREYVRGPLDVGHLCPDRRRRPDVPGEHQIVAICNPDSAFYGRLAEVVSVHDRTVFLRFVAPGISISDDNVAFPFGASEVVALAPGEVTEVFGR